MKLTKHMLMVQGFANNDSSNFFLPDGNYPSWLAYACEGPSVLFQVPEDIHCHMNGIVLSVVYSSTSENMATECLTNVLIINYTKCTIQIYKGDTVMSFNDEDWKGLTSNLGPGDNVEIFVAFRHGLIAKETVVYLIYNHSVTVETDSSINVEMKQSPEVNLQPSSVVKMEPLLDVKTEPSRNRNEKIFSRLAKRIGKCLCIERNRGLNNF